MGSGVSFNWGQIGSKPSDLVYQDTVDKIVSGKYTSPTSTSINGTEIRSPVITGAILNGGVINVTTNINLGKKSLCRAKTHPLSTTGMHLLIFAGRSFGFPVRVIQKYRGFHFTLRTSATQAIFLQPASPLEAMPPPLKLG